MSDSERFLLISFMLFYPSGALEFQFHLVDNISAELVVFLADANMFHVLEEVFPGVPIVFVREACGMAGIFV